jgi:cyanophycin synthetase
MAEYSPGKPVYVTMKRENDLVRRHIREGGRAVALEEGLNGRMIVVYEGEEQIPLLWARQIPATVEGHAIHNIQNAMFATAVAHAMGISLENIRQGLRTFTTDFFQTPGRMNFYNEHPFRVLLDYAHNAHGMAAMAQTIRGLTVNGRRIGVLAAPGDRRDEDILAMGRIAAAAFDRLVFREAPDGRGRAMGEVNTLLTDGALAAGAAPDHVRRIIEESEAAQACLQMAEPGDLVVLLPTDVSAVWAQVKRFSPAMKVDQVPPEKLAAHG